MMYMYTSSTAQGGGGSFKNRKPIKVLEVSHSFSLFLSLSTYLPIFYVSIYLSIYLSLSFI